MQFVNWCTVCVRESVCPVHYVPHHSPLSTVPGPPCPSYCWTNTKQIVCKGHGAAYAGSLPITRKANLWDGLELCRVTPLPWRERGHWVCMEIRVAPALCLFEFLFACGLVFKGGRARMEVVPTKIPTSPSRAAEEVSFRLIAVCLITVLFLCSADDTYILRHSHASCSKLVLTGSSPDSSWRNSSAHLSTTQLRETTD